MFGVGLFNADGVCCYGTNTNIEEMDPTPHRAARCEVAFDIDSLDLVEGTYKLDVAVHKLRRLPVRLPPPALHVPREVADARTSASTGRITSGRSRPASGSRRPTDGDADRRTRTRPAGWPTGCAARD